MAGILLNPSGCCCGAGACSCDGEPLGSIATFTATFHSTTKGSTAITLTKSPTGCTWLVICAAIPSAFNRALSINLTFNPDGTISLGVSVRSTGCASNIGACAVGAGLTLTSKSCSPVHLEFAMTTCSELTNATNGYTSITITE